jgi:hypothetical protein
MLMALQHLLFLFPHSFLLFFHFFHLQEGARTLNLVLSSTHLVYRTANTEAYSCNIPFVCTTQQ